MVTIPIPVGTLSQTGFTLRMMEDRPEKRVLAFDVGGSHVAAAVCRGNDYQLGPVVSSTHSAVNSPEGFLDLLHGLGQRAGYCGSGSIGAMLAVPGPFDLEAGVSLMRHKLPYLYGVDLRSGLATRFELQPSQVGFVNDADAYLLGEIGAGAARGFRRAVGITLGTGIGSAFAVDGRLVVKGPGVPKGGEIWNLQYQGGIVEDFVSSRAIVGNYERFTQTKREVVDLAAAARNDPAARQAFEEFGRHLGDVILTVLTDFQSEVIVLGGGISRSAELFMPAVRAQLGNSPVQLRVSELKDKAALVGCGVAAFRSGHGLAEPVDPKSVHSGAA